MNIGERMKTRRKQLKISADEVAEKIGVSRSNVYRYEKGDIEKLPIEVLEPLSEILKTTPQFLMGWENEEDILPLYNELNPERKQKVYSFAEKQLEEQNKKTAFKVYGDVAAGPAIEYNEAEVETHYAESVPVSADMALTINGDSMEPEFPNGSIVFYKHQQQVEHGEIAIVEIDGNSVTCKKVCYDYDNKKVVLQSLNDKYEDMEYEANHIRILGKVVK